jgi:putative membrane protein
MKTVMPTIIAVVALIASPAFSQTPRESTTPPAVATPSTPPPAAAPVPGANSFTEGQAKSRIESMGYTNVASLAKDDKGIWRGKAVKDGRTMNISVDFQGNVTAQ